MSSIIDVIFALILGASSSILAVFIMKQFVFGRRLLMRVFPMPYGLARSLAIGGITRMTLSRADYHKQRVGKGVLREYLATAKNTIDIVSISMNVSQSEGSLISLFEERLRTIDNFIVRITLLHPKAPSVEILAKSLDVATHELEHEIKDTLDKLSRCKSSLPDSAAARLLICTHDIHPIGSAILLDATEKGGLIQIETKLYRAPRTESFGFEIKGPTEFYLKNYESWKKVFKDSEVWNS